MNCTLTPRIVRPDLRCTREQGHAPGCVYVASWALDPRHDDQTQEED